MQAIETKVLPYTQTRPRRIKAVCARGSIVVSIHDARLEGITRDEDRHAKVARLLCQSFEDEDRAQDRAIGIWDMPFVSGCLANGNWVHVFLPR